jgi:superfamily II DNA or RNA helicase
MKFEGTIYLDPTSPKSIVVDAEPHIMLRLRKIFDHTRPYYTQGKYTHKPIVFPLSLSSCRDMTWLMERYRFDCDASLNGTIQEKSGEYDDIVKSVEDADNDPVYHAGTDFKATALPLREHQIRFGNMFKKVRRMLLADVLGLGKTFSALSTICDPKNLPAIIIVPAHLCTQWEKETKRLLPDMSTHVIRGFKNYPLPVVDVLITTYNRLGPWQDTLISDRHSFNTVIFDEVHELRHTGTTKRSVAALFSEKAKQVLGLSGTPIFNMGSEIWSVLDVIKPDCLGGYDDFVSEWCTWGKVLEPATLNSYLKKQGLLLRRTPEQAGQTLHEPSKHVITIDADLDKLKEVENVAKTLALSVLSGNVSEDNESAREFDWKLRHATGVAKARPVASVIRMILEQEEKVLVAAWHRDCHDILQKELKDFKIVMYTGTESGKEKDQAVKDFIEGDARIFLISLRSGSGLDGLQRVCNTVVLAELDWSCHVLDQIVGRLARDGQTRPVQAFYLTIADGSDPFMLSLIGEKRSQHAGLIEGRESEADLLKDSSAGRERVREMARAYLKSIGEEIPEAVPEVGLLGKLASTLRQYRVPTNTEAEMQTSVHSVLLKTMDASVRVDRELTCGKRNRVDFMVSDSNEKIVIECKIDATNRASVYRQVRRYIEELNITSLVLLAPWNGIASFKVDGIPVIVLDTSVSQI